MAKVITIRELREQKRLTQLEFAQSIGMSSIAVSKWECGKRKPSLNTIRKIEQKYKVTLNY